MVKYWARSSSRQSQPQARPPHAPAPGRAPGLAADARNPAGAAPDRDPFPARETQHIKQQHAGEGGNAHRDQRLGRADRDAVPEDEPRDAADPARQDAEADRGQDQDSRNQQQPEPQQPNRPIQQEPQRPDRGDHRQQIWGHEAQRLDQRIGQHGTGRAAEIRRHPVGGHIPGWVVPVICRQHQEQHDAAEEQRHPGEFAQAPPQKAAEAAIGTEAGAESGHHGPHAIRAKRSSASVTMASSCTSASLRYPAPGLTPAASVTPR